MRMRVRIGTRIIINDNDEDDGYADDTHDVCFASHVFASHQFSHDVEHAANALYLIEVAPAATFRSRRLGICARGSRKNCIASRVNQSSILTRC